MLIASLKHYSIQKYKLIYVCMTEWILVTLPSCVCSELCPVSGMLSWDYYGVSLYLSQVCSYTYEYIRIHVSSHTYRIHNHTHTHKVITIA